MKKTVFFLIVIAVASKFLGFFREIVLSYFYGTSSISDVYLISLTIPTVIFSFLGTAITTGYIPIYSKIENEMGTSKGNEFTSNLITITLLICTSIIFLGLLFTNQLVKIFASGFSGETLSIAVLYTRIGLFGIYFMGVTYIFIGYLQIKDKFYTPALIGIPLNVVTILSIILSSRINTLILPIGTIVATMMQLIFLLLFVYKTGYRYSPLMNIKDEHLRSMILISMPIVIGISINQINVLVDRTIASQIAVGGISALNYANRLILFIQGIVVIPIATVMYPMTSKMVIENNVQGLKKSLREAINFVNLLVMPATIGLMIFAEPVVRMLFGRGAFNDMAISMTSDSLYYYLIGMVAYGLREVISRVFYSYKDTKTPMVNAGIAVLLNIILNLLLSRYMGIGGLALATSISGIVSTSLLFISLRRRIGSFGIKNISVSFAKILLATVIMGVVSTFIYNSLVLFISSNLTLIISIGIAAISYLAIIYFMKIDGVDEIIVLLKRKMKKN